MKRRFVIDENSLILAGKGENERGEEDFSARMLLADIAENCHIVAINSQVHNKYQSQMRQVPSSEVAWLLRQIYFAEPEKIHQQEDPPPVEGEGGFHLNDVPFVRLAVAAQAILVTTDNDLRDDLKAASVTNKYELNVLRPEEALSLAGPTDD